MTASLLFQRAVYIKVKEAEKAEKLQYPNTKKMFDYSNVYCTNIRAVNLQVS